METETAAATSTGDSSCSSELEPLSQKHNGRNARIVIVGAGIAGLTAASTLIKYGFNNVVVLEAEGRLGGRAHSLEEADGSILELGASWMHYSSTSLFKLCESHGMFALHPKTNLPIRDDEILDHMLIFSEQHKPLPRVLSDCVFEDSTSILSLADWLRPEYVANNSSNGSGSSSDDDDTSFDEGEPQCPVHCGVGAKNPRECALSDFVLEKHARVKLEAKDADDYRRRLAGLDLGIRIMLDNEGASSMFALSRVGHKEETGSGSYLTRLQVPLSSMIGKLRANVPDSNIKLNCLVHKIHLSNDGNTSAAVNVTFEQMGVQEVIAADHVIFTGSVGVLKSKHAALFSPPLPNDKQRAIGVYGFGNMGKIFFKYPISPSTGRTWWQENLHKWSERSRQTLDPNQPFSMNMVWFGCGGGGEQGTDDVDMCSHANVYGQVRCADVDGGGVGVGDEKKKAGKVCSHNWTRQIAGVYFIPINKRVKNATDTSGNSDKEKFELDFSWCNIMLPGSISDQVDLLNDTQVLADFNAFMRHMVGDADAPDAVRVVRRRWSLEPNYRGTYSHCSVGCAREFGTSGADILSRPEWMYAKQAGNSTVLPGLMFAGEATYTEGLGYMHGAYETGLREARRLLEAYTGVQGN